MEHINNHSKYTLAYCEIFNSKIHGKDNSSSKNIDSHYLIFMTLHNRYFYNHPEFVEISNHICSIREKIKNRYFNFFMFAHYLKAAQFIPRIQNPIGGIGAINIHLLKLPDYRRAKVS